MSPEYPAFRCLFCHKLFSSRKAVYDHLDHFIPEYCHAYGVKLRQQGNAYHPLAVLRYIRSDINRNREIHWELDPTLVPMEGVPWNFAIPVPDKAARDAALREGYHTASWWVDRLCQPRVAPPPPATPPAPPAGSVAAHFSRSVAGAIQAAAVNRDINANNIDAGSIAGHFSRSVAGAIQAAAAVNGDINANNIDAGSIAAHFSRSIAGSIQASAVNGDINTNIIDAHRHDSDSRRSRHRPRTLTPVRRPTPRRVRFTPSPFMRATAPLVATVLHVRFFGKVYPVEITRRMELRGAMAALKQVVPGDWDDGTWAMFGLAGEEDGEAWCAADWAGLKRRWIEKVGEGERAWVVMKGA